MRQRHRAAASFESTKHVEQTAKAEIPDGELFLDRQPRFGVFTAGVISMAALDSLNFLPSK